MHLANSSALPVASSAGQERVGWKYEVGPPFLTHREGRVEWKSLIPQPPGKIMTSSK